MESNPRSALIKRGTVSYEPVPLFGEDSVPKNALPQTGEKTVQVLKEKNTQTDRTAQAEAGPEEIVSRAKDEAHKTREKGKADAERALAEASNKAKKLIEESKLYCKEAEQNAKREGLALGKKEGFEAAYQELKQIMEAAGDTLKQTIQEKERLEKSAEQALAQLAIKIAERVIGSELTVNNNVAVNMVKANLERVKEREHVTIHVHQDDLENVKKNREIFSRLVPDIRSIEVQSDPRVERGGCIIETNLGTLDARISTQLEAIALAFVDADLVNPPEIEEENSDASPD